MAERSRAYWKNVKAKMRLQPFVHAVESSAVPIAIADPFEDDAPLVFVNDAFLKLVGYDEEEVLGRNCRFLQGEKTDPAHREALRRAIERRETISQEILNYRKDGSTFWNELHMAPMLDDNGDLLYFIATQVDVSDRVNRQANLQGALDRKTDELREQALKTHEMAQEMSHRVRNSLTLVYSLLMQQMRAVTDATARSALAGALGRIGAIVEIQRVIDGNASRKGASLREGLVAICNLLDQFGDVRVTHEIADVAVPEDLLTPVALIINELVTNAQKHAFSERPPGRVHVVVAADGETLRISVRDDGKGLPHGYSPRGITGFGTRMMMMEIDRHGGSLETRVNEPGSEFIITLPNPSAVTQTG